MQPYTHQSVLTRDTTQTLFTPLCEINLHTYHLVAQSFNYKGLFISMALIKL